MGEQISDTEQANIMNQQIGIWHQVEDKHTITKGYTGILKYLIIFMAISVLFVMLIFNPGDVANQRDVQTHNVNRGISVDVESQSTRIKPISSKDSKKNDQSGLTVVKNKDKAKQTLVVQESLKGTKAIKGNINQDGEKIYHLPRQTSYERTKPEISFGTEDEAIAAGFRKAKDPLIKGNINNQGEKIYHLPGQAYYSKTKPEEWFFTEADAQKAGYRKSKR